MQYDSFELLLSTFETVLLDEMSAFLQGFGVKHYVGLCGTAKPIPNLKTVNYANVSSNFVCINRFSTDNFVIDIYYGGKEFFIQPKIYYLKCQKWFGIWEILEALNVETPHSVSGAWWVREKDVMTLVLQNITSGIKCHWRHLAFEDSRIISIALANREERLSAFSY